jgi:acyl-homoserine-lactone acylase
MRLRSIGARDTPVGTSKGGSLARRRAACGVRAPTSPLPTLRFMSRSLCDAADTRSHTMRFILVIVITTAVAVVSGAPTNQPSSSSTTEILWDRYGVPHISSSSVTGLFRAFGWAQMKSHANLLLQQYAIARGRSSEYFEGDVFTQSDRWVLLNSVPERAREWYEQQPAAFRANLDAFAAGINDYARQHSDELAADVRGLWPVSAVDVLAHVQRVTYFSFLTSPGILGPPADGSSSGSNAWAVAPKKSASGHAMLIANPHLSWSGRTTLYEAQLTAPGVNVSGVALVGFPVLGIGFNDQLGWSVTTNPLDAVDLYDLEPTTDGGYIFDGSPRRFDTTTRVLKVKRGGATIEESLLVRTSVHGVVIGDRRGRPVAMRVAGLDRAGLCEQLWDMARASNLRQFESAVARLQYPMFSIVYADRAGHIMYVFNGAVPIRPSGELNWRGIVSGASSATLWTRIHPYADLPRVADPPSGWLQNANDPPWMVTMPSAIRRDSFPPYMAPSALGFRAQRALRVLNQPDKLSFAQLVAAKQSTRMELADRIVDDVVAAARRVGSPRLTASADILERWDRTADADSRGGVLFQRFVSGWYRPNDAFAVAWDEDRPLLTPMRLADEKRVLDALDKAAQEVETQYGALDVRWGTVFRVRRDGVDLPASGAPGDPFGVVRVLGYARGKDGKFEANIGESYVAAIEFGRSPRAEALLAYGNASQPGSPHRTDQLALFAAKQLRPVWRTREQVLAHLSTREKF